jgi:hypothetical protein
MPSFLDDILKLNGVVIFPKSTYKTVSLAAKLLKVYAFFKTDRQTSCVTRSTTLSSFSPVRDNLRVLVDIVCGAEQDKNSEGTDVDEAFSPTARETVSFLYPQTLTTASDSTDSDWQHEGLPMEARESVYDEHCLMTSETVLSSENQSSEAVDVPECSKDFSAFSRSETQELRSADSLSSFEEKHSEVGSLDVVRQQNQRFEETVAAEENEDILGLETTDTLQREHVFVENDQLESSKHETENVSVANIITDQDKEDLADGKPVHEKDGDLISFDLPPRSDILTELDVAGSNFDSTSPKHSGRAALDSDATYRLFVGGVSSEMEDSPSAAADSVTADEAKSLFIEECRSLGGDDQLSKPQAQISSAEQAEIREPDELILVSHVAVTDLLVVEEASSPAVEQKFGEEEYDRFEILQTDLQPKEPCLDDRTFAEPTLERSDSHEDHALLDTDRTESQTTARALTETEDSLAEPEYVVFVQPQRISTSELQYLEQFTNIVSAEEFSAPVAEKKEDLQHVNEQDSYESPKDNLSFLNDDISTGKSGTRTEVDAAASRMLKELEEVSDSRSEGGDLFDLAHDAHTVMVPFEEQLIKATEWQVDAGSVKQQLQVVESLTITVRDDSEVSAVTDTEASAVDDAVETSSADSLPTVVEPAEDEETDEGETLPDPIIGVLPGRSDVTVFATTELVSSGNVVYGFPAAIIGCRPEDYADEDELKVHDVEDEQEEEEEDDSIDEVRSYLPGDTTSNLQMTGMPGVLDSILEEEERTSSQKTTSSSEKLERETTDSSKQLGSYPDVLHITESSGKIYSGTGKSSDKDDISISSSLSEFERLERELQEKGNGSLESVSPGKGSSESALVAPVIESPRGRFTDEKDGHTSLSSSLAEFEQIEHEILGQSGSLELIAVERKSRHTDSSSFSELARIDEAHVAEVSADSKFRSSSSSLSEFERIEHQLRLDEELEAEASKVADLLERGSLSVVSEYSESDSSKPEISMSKDQLSGSVAEDLAQPDATSVSQYPHYQDIVQIIREASLNVEKFEFQGHEVTTVAEVTQTFDDGDKQQQIVTAEEFSVCTEKRETVSERSETIVISNLPGNYEGFSWDSQQVHRDMIRNERVVTSEVQHHASESEETVSVGYQTSSEGKRELSRDEEKLESHDENVVAISAIDTNFSRKFDSEFSWNSQHIQTETIRSERTVTSEIHHHAAVSEETVFVGNQTLSNSAVPSGELDTSLPGDNEEDFILDSQHIQTEQKERIATGEIQHCSTVFEETVSFGHHILSEVKFEQSRVGETFETRDDSTETTTTTDNVPVIYFSEQQTCGHEPACVEQEVGAPEAFRDEYFTLKTAHEEDPMQLSIDSLAADASMMTSTDSLEFDAEQVEHRDGRTTESSVSDSERGTLTFQSENELFFSDLVGQTEISIMDRSVDSLEGDETIAAERDTSYAESLDAAAGVSSLVSAGSRLEKPDDSLMSRSIDSLEQDDRNLEESYDMVEPDDCGEQAVATSQSCESFEADSLQDDAEEDQTLVTSHSRDSLLLAASGAVAPMDISAGSSGAWSQSSMSSCTTLASSSDGDLMQTSADVLPPSEHDGQRRLSEPSSTTPTAGWSHRETGVFTFDNNQPGGGSVAILDAEGNIMVVDAEPHSEDEQRTPLLFQVADNQQSSTSGKDNNNRAASLMKTLEETKYTDVSGEMSPGRPETTVKAVFDPVRSTECTSMLPLEAVPSDQQMWTDDHPDSSVQSSSSSSYATSDTCYCGPHESSETLAGSASGERGWFILISALYLIVCH